MLIPRQTYSRSAPPESGPPARRDPGIPGRFPARIRDNSFYRECTWFAWKTIQTPVVSTSLKVTSLKVIKIWNKPGNGAQPNFHLFPSVTGSTDDGFLEGSLRGQTGTFPAHCVQEVRLRNPPQSTSAASVTSDLTSNPRSPASVISNGSVNNNNRVVGRREVKEQQQQHFSTATRAPVKM